jgi:hypothetical protein
MTDIITTKPLTETETLFQDLNKPSLQNLSYALRHPDTWPEGFNWQYQNCGTCAMGLAHELWKEIPQTYFTNGASIMAKAFAMPYSEANDIFMRGRNAPRKAFIGPRDPTRQTPERVADAIDAYLKTAE